MSNITFDPFMPKKIRFRDISILTYPNLASFPITGKEGIIYIALDTDKTYIWDSITTSYIEVDSVTPVIDNLTSTSTTSALSANQGRVLKGLIDGLNHNTSLAGLQGGQANEYFHFTQAEYSAYNPTNWNTAYGWGDHAVEGYLKNIVEDTTPQLGGDLDTNSNDIKFLDNDKAIFGTGLDAEMYSDGQDLIIRQLTQDRDIIFNVNDGGVDTEVARLIGNNTSFRVQSDITNVNGNLEVTREDSNGNHKFYVYGNATQRSLMNFFKYHGTSSSPTAVTSGSQIFDFQMKGYDGVLATGQTVTRFISSVDVFNGADDISGYLEFQTRAVGVGQTVVPRVRYEGGGLMRMFQTAGCSDCATICYEEKDTTPANPTQDTEVKQYMKDDKLIWQFNNGGTIRYFFIDLTQTVAQQVQHTTTAP